MFGGSWSSWRRTHGHVETRRSLCPGGGLGGQAREIPLTTGETRISDIQNCPSDSAGSPSVGRTRHRHPTAAPVRVSPSSQQRKGRKTRRTSRRPEKWASRVSQRGALHHASQWNRVSLLIRRFALQPQPHPSIEVNLSYLPPWGWPMLLCFLHTQQCPYIELRTSRFRQLCRRSDGSLIERQGERVCSSRS